MHSTKFPFLTAIQCLPNMHLWPFGLRQLHWLLHQTVRSIQPVLSLFESYTDMMVGIFTFLVVEITPISISSIGYRTYIYFAGMFKSRIFCRIKH
jgi:hypothetical protein